MSKEATRRKPVSTATNRRQDIALEQTSGNFALIDTLRKWGITFFSGVNGGGLILRLKSPVNDLVAHR